MNCAVLPQVKQPDKLAMYRDKAHRELDKFIDRLAPKLLQEDPLTLQEISDAFAKYVTGDQAKKYLRTNS